MTFWTVYGFYTMAEMIFDLFLDSLPFYSIFKMFLLIIFVSPLTNGYFVVFQCIIVPILKKREDQIELNFTSCLKNINSYLVKTSLMAISSLDEENTNENTAMRNENEIKEWDYTKFRRWSFDSQSSFQEAESEYNLNYKLQE